VNNTFRNNNSVPLKKPIEIFLIEDDSLDQRQVKRVFDQREIRSNITTFKNGKEALEVLLELDPTKLPNIILLDINMPLMNGIEFLSEIRKHSKFSGLKCFVLSNSDEEREVCRSLGVSGYILKPLKLSSPSTDTITLMIDMMNI
jgi:CheY-like chemotaxis protein